MDLAVGEHVRGDAPDYPEEVYRVVGLPGDEVTLLRVTEGGDRANTGEVVTVARAELVHFERVPDPDAGFDPVGWIREWFEGLAIILKRIVGR